MTEQTKKSKKKKIKKGSIFLIIAVLIGWGVYNTYKSGSSASESGLDDIRTTTVTRGDLSVFVTGSGSIISSDRTDITPKVNGTIEKVNFEEGDEVKIGDVLYEIDDDDAVLQIERTINDIEERTLSTNENIKDVGKLVVRAPFSGVISNISIDEGDNISKNATFLSVTDFSNFKVNIPFNKNTMSKIKIGQEAVIYLKDLMHSTKGVVSKINKTPYTTSNGGQVIDVQFKIENKGALTEGMKVSATINGVSSIYSSTDYGTLEHINKSILKSEVIGTIKNIRVYENQKVYRGDVLVQLENDDLKLSVDSANIGIKELKAELGLLNSQLENYKIISPIDGVIVTQSIKEGDVIKSGDVLSKISNDTKMEFDVEVDELDIAKIKKGQNAVVTIDAITETIDKPLDALVSKIALSGISSNGVTTYPVTIQIQKPVNLKEGMNANADIVVSKKENALLLPVEAVEKEGNKSYVTVMATSELGKNMQNRIGNREGLKNGDNSERNKNRGNVEAGSIKENKQGNLDGNKKVGRNKAGGKGQRKKTNTNVSEDDGTTKIYIKVGINNESSVEILKGLNEGDEVILPSLGKSNSDSESKKPSGFGGMKRMGGSRR